MAFRRPSRGSEPSIMRRDALENRADRGMRAYVTGSDDARDARLRARYDLAPIVWASSMARGTRAARRPRAARTAIGGDLGVGLRESRRRLRCSAGTTATQVATLKAAGGVMVPVVSTGTREGSTRTNSRTTSATLRVAPRRIDPASSAGPLRRLGRFRAHGRGN